MTALIHGAVRLVFLLAAIALIWIIVASVMANAADQDRACLTLQQARNKYPTTHLFWYYEDRHSQGRRCWSNRRGGPPHMKDPLMGHTKVGQLNAVRWYPRPFDDRSPPIDPPILLDPPDIPDPECCWPELTEFEKRWGAMPVKPDGEKK